MIVSLASLITVPSLADVVHQRGDRPALEGAIRQVDEDGVTIETLAGVTQVRWDWVREVESKHHDADVDRHLGMAELLWRARSRLERHDAAMAEPLFDRLFEDTRGQTNAVALVVSEGVLRCRLSRGALETAVIPALETIRLRRALQGVSDIYSSLPPILDDRTWLCMALPPAWSDTTALIATERALANYNTGKDNEVAAMAYWYRRAARQALALRIDSDEQVPKSNQPGIALLREFVTCASSDEGQRTAARATLLTDIESAPNWVQAWSHYAIGLSLLSEQDSSQQRQGLVHLTHLPARFGTVQPLLAGSALAKLADWCDAVGDSEAAASLRHDLATRFPSVAAGLPASRRSSGVDVPRSVIATKDSP